MPDGQTADAGRRRHRPRRHRSSNRTSSVADRLAELTTVARGFEALQKAISVLMNDVDGRAIDDLGGAELRSYGPTGRPTATHGPQR